MSDLPPPPPPPPPPGGYGAAPAGGYGASPPLAEIGPRLIAYIIDWVAIPLGAYIVLIILGAILGDTIGGIIFLLGVLAIFGFVLWQYYQEGTTGQTIGKKMQNIKLVGLENGGQPIGFGMAFVRVLVNQLVCGLGWFLAFFDPQKQTLGDKVSKSIVVPA